MFRNVADTVKNPDIENYKPMFTLGGILGVATYLSSSSCSASLTLLLASATLGSLTWASNMYANGSKHRPTMFKPVDSSPVIEPQPAPANENNRQNVSAP